MMTPSLPTEKINAMTETETLIPALTIEGASCQGCARKIRAALEPITGSTDRVGVDIDGKTVALPAGTDLTDAAQRVTDAGYPATPLHREPPAGPEQTASDQPSPDTAASPDTDSGHPSARQDNDGVQLSVTGATCASCVASIEKALLSVSGVTSAHMNLANSSASATGNADPDALVQAVRNAGYGATIIDDPDA